MNAETMKHEAIRQWTIMEGREPLCGLPDYLLESLRAKYVLGFIQGGLYVTGYYKRELEAMQQAT